MQKFEKTGQKNVFGRFFWKIFNKKTRFFLARAPPLK